jgi:uncharacterized membrane protein YkvA (DUF1232 family)
MLSGSSAKSKDCVDMDTRSFLERWKHQARALRTETYALYLAYRDPRTPWYARAFALLVVAYAFSPLDLIPDPVPVLGYLDDLVLIPLGILLARKMVPQEILTACREQARAAISQPRPRLWTGAAIVIALWLVAAVLGVLLLWKLLRTLSLDRAP